MHVIIVDAHEFSRVHGNAFSAHGTRVAVADFVSKNVDVLRVVEGQALPSFRGDDVFEKVVADNTLGGIAKGDPWAGRVFNGVSRDGNVANVTG